MKVGLFVPCYVDALYPEAGVATYKLLKHYGLDVDYPEKQTCCGQPMANAGFQDKSEKVIETFDELFKDYDYIVAPSASCAAYVKVYYPKILEGKHECVSSKKIMDVVEFLHDVLKVDHVPGKFPHVVSVHNSCHGVRELGLSSPSERHIKPFNKIIDLLNMVEGITIHEPERKDECCGFGGMFSIEEPAVSTRMGEDKIKRHMATGAEYITGADSSCLMHMQGEPRTMQKNPVYTDLLSEVKSFLAERARALTDLGVSAEKIVLDPGFGFGKTVSQNFELLAKTEDFLSLGYPLLYGMSRKSSLGAVTGITKAEERLISSVTAHLLAVERGASIVRVHDVKQMKEALTIYKAMVHYKDLK